MNVGLFEDSRWVQLLPLVWMRSPFELRCGRDLLIDKIRSHIGRNICRLWLRDWMRRVVVERTSLSEPDAKQDWWLFNARLLVRNDLVGPPPGVVWEADGAVLAIGVRAKDIVGLTPENFLDDQRRTKWLKDFRRETPPKNLRLVEYPWDLILANGEELRRQCGGEERAGVVDPGVHMLNPSEIRVGRGARIKPGVVLDAEDGPVQIDEGTMIEPNAVIQGPCYIGPHTIVRPGTVIRGDTSIGPVCKVGGEIEASVFQGCSNKQHDGFLGHSFVAEWVNLGADTITSDLKNTYGTIRAAINGVGVETGQHFVGSMFGDHAKTGIGTILPTGGVIGVAANVFTQSPVPKFVPSFAWLTDAGLTDYRVEKAIHIAGTVMARRDRHLGKDEETLLKFVRDEAKRVEALGWT